MNTEEKKSFYFQAARTEEGRVRLSKDRGKDSGQDGVGDEGKDSTNKIKDWGKDGNGQEGSECLKGCSPCKGSERILNANDAGVVYKVRGLKVFNNDVESVKSG